MVEFVGEWHGFFLYVNGFCVLWREQLSVCCDLNGFVQWSQWLTFVQLMKRRGLGASVNGYVQLVSGLTTDRGTMNGVVCWTGIVWCGSTPLKRLTIKRKSINNSACLPAPVLSCPCWTGAWACGFLWPLPTGSGILTNKAPSLGSGTAMTGWFYGFVMWVIESSF